MKKVYAAFIGKEQIIVPDLALENTFSNKLSLEKGIEAAREMIELKLAYLLKENLEIPEATTKKLPKEDSKDFVFTYVDADPAHYDDVDELEIHKKEVWNVNENVIEFETNAKTMYVTVSQRKYINKVKKLAESNPDEVIIKCENKDGSVYAKMPVKYLRLTKPSAGRTFTEEEIEANRERLAKAREARFKK